jgi:hypothetical protein
MTLKIRRMKSYHPRNRTRGSSLVRQALHDMQHVLSRDIGELLVLAKEGAKGQISDAQHKAKSTFLKTAPEMSKEASKLGDLYVTSVREYLNSIDEIIHSNPLTLDPATISRCYATTAQLEKQLKAA